MAYLPGGTTSPTFTGGTPVTLTTTVATYGAVSFPTSTTARLSSPGVYQATFGVEVNNAATSNTIFNLTVNGVSDPSRSIKLYQATGAGGTQPISSLTTLVIVSSTIPTTLQIVPTTTVLLGNLGNGSAGSTAALIAYMTIIQLQ